MAEAIIYGLAAPQKLAMIGNIIDSEAMNAIQLVKPRICKRRGILYQISLLLFSTWRVYFYSQPSNFYSQPNNK